MDDISKLFGTDTLEDELQRLYPEAFLLLLKDHTTDRNIFWATGDYEELGKGYESASPIVPELITGEHGNVITPRVLKNRAIQIERVRDKAEVFTPSWICNAQNNLIDEAHRGAQGRDAATATTIMQKFLKGSPNDGIQPMPVVIGMSATPARFNALVGETTSTIHKCVVTAEEVRASGLLKDRIIFKYPGNSSTGSELAVLQAAADNWKEKWDHWEQYCREQHHAYVNPVFVVQVLNGTGTVISHTNLDDCLNAIEERVGRKFGKGEVVHTFGQTTASLTMNGLEVAYVEPSQIADDRKIKLVFFKENLSTGWDCPRAETMMSFRPAKDATYIAQLLGRMVRTPMQMHIQVDDVLNDVHLYLPHFDEKTVNEVVDALQNSEGGDIPTGISADEIDTPSIETWTTPTYNEPEEGEEAANTTDEQTEQQQEQPTDTRQGQQEALTGGEETPPEVRHSQQEASGNYAQTAEREKAATDEVHEAGKETERQEERKHLQKKKRRSNIDRDAILKFINQSGLLSYDVRTVKVSKNYRASLNKLSNLLVVSGQKKDAVAEVRKEIVDMIHRYVEELKTNGTYDAMMAKVRQFELKTQIFDAFGQSLTDKGPIQTDFTTTDADIERQFRIADGKLGVDGIGYAYGGKHGEPTNPAVFKIDVILFASDDECISQLESYCKVKFHAYNDEYRRKFATIGQEKYLRQYNDIVSDSDPVSMHSFRIPGTLQARIDSNGKEYGDHLLVNPHTGVAKIKLNGWEEATLEEERKRADYVCWLRNLPRASWALCIPYKQGNVTKPTYPDIIVIRKEEGGYVVDVLEPHQPTLEDNLGKAQGFAEYARQNTGVGRIQLLRMVKDGAGHDRMKRLDMSRSEVREKVLKLMNQDELNHLFETDGFIDNGNI